MKPRKYLWRATYRNGVSVTELPGEGNGPSIGFGDVPRAGLARLAIVDASTGREAAGLDLATGCVDLHGERLDPRLGDVAITGRGKVDPVTVFQHKAAHAERRADGSVSGTIVDYHAIGYTKALAEGKLVVDLRVRPECGHARLFARLRRPPGSPPPNPLVFVSPTRAPQAPPPTARDHRDDGR